MCAYNRLPAPSIGEHEAIKAEVDVDKFSAAATPNFGHFAAARRGVPMLKLAQLNPLGWAFTLFFFLAVLDLSAHACGIDVLITNWNQRKFDKAWARMQFICLVDEVTVWWIMYAVESGIEFGLYESVLLGNPANNERNLKESFQVHRSTPALEYVLWLPEAGVHGFFRTAVLEGRSKQSIRSVNKKMPNNETTVAIQDLVIHHYENGGKTQQEIAELVKKSRQLSVT
ncbi:hypothetical protein Fcan01_27716 [Folsomia candida]|uniref:Uncharacterized protein n=1 Tax=Folsomia candida TaxID=158441 RepID=A0A226CWZ7_FOLCA|nr:hypothetical protein Fcan01_27716 [Folsomia candida]